jgi:hypothetical protein
MSFVEFKLLNKLCFDQNLVSTQFFGVFLERRQKGGGIGSSTVIRWGSRARLPRSRWACRAARAPRSHAAACWSMSPCDVDHPSFFSSSFWTSHTADLELPCLYDRNHPTKLRHSIHPARNVSSQFDFPITFAISLRTLRTSRSAPCPTQSPERLLSSPTPAGTTAMSPLCGQAFLEGNMPC